MNETHMQAEALFACYNRMLELLDRTDAAIDRQDMDAVCLCDQETTLLTGEIEALSSKAVELFGDAQAVSRMETIIRRTLSRLGETQARVAGWAGETGAALGRLNYGATAVRTYASPLRTGALYADRQA